MLPPLGIIILFVSTPFVTMSYENQPAIITQIEMNGPDTHFDSSTLCVNGHGNSGTQWFVLHNMLKTTIQIDNFGLLASSDVPPGFRQGEVYNPNSYITLGPGQSCMYVFLTANVPFIQIPQNASISISYSYRSANYTFITPPLTDIYHDSRTWQYNGTGWLFTDKQPVIPEFPFVTITILTAGFASLIMFSRIKNKI